MCLTVNLGGMFTSVVKSSALCLFGAYVLWGMLPQLLLLPSSPPAAIGSAVWYARLRIGIWTIFVFFFVSVLEAWYKKFSYTKQLSMSRGAIRQEGKEKEGDSDKIGRASWRGRVSAYG